jgi:LPXTG-motif cell wall-anchored protein
VFAPPTRPADPGAVPTGNDGFDFGDAGIGAAVVAGASAILLAAAALVVGRRRRLGPFLP